MYCSSCGVAVSQALTYCNHCGAKLNSAKTDDLSEARQANPELLVSAMAATFILGLVAIAVLLGVLKQVAGFDPPFLIAATAFCFALLLLIEGMLMKMLISSRSKPKIPQSKKTIKDASTRELHEANARVLAEPVPSVTEHTTRAFDPIYSERKQK